MPILENSVQYFLASTFFLPALELSDYQSHRCLDLCQLIKKNTYSGSSSLFEFHKKTICCYYFCQHTFNNLNTQFGVVDCHLVTVLGW